MTLNLQGQEEILTKTNLYPFILKVDSLNQEFENLKKKEYLSIQQTNADYVRIITKEPESFIADLNAGLGPNQILEKYDNSAVDKNVLITKTKYTNYKKENSIQFQSYEIGSNKDHNVKIQFDEILYNKLELKGKYIFDSYYSKREGTTRIDAFFILSDFERTKLNPQIASYIDYSDLIIGDEKIFKYNEKSEIPDSVFNPIDSLLAFFNIQTRKPIRNKDEPYSDFKERLNKWDTVKQDQSDSIFINNHYYRNLIIQAKNLLSKYTLRILF